MLKLIKINGHIHSNVFPVLICGAILIDLLMTFPKLVLYLPNLM